MATVVFNIMLWLFIITLIATTYYREKQNKTARFEKLKESFGQKVLDPSSDERFDKIPKLYTYMNENHQDSFYLDDITVNDLRLRTVYSRMNRCVTGAGSDMMYCRFRTLPSDLSRANSCYDSIVRYINDKEQAVKLIGILDHVGNDPDTDGFMIINDLEGAQEKSILTDIVPLIMLLLSGVLAAFYPIVGLTAVIVMICICIFLYFKGKHSMDENLRGLALALRLVKCSSLLYKAGCEEFSKYEDLKKLSGGDFLISYKDKSTSDPLSLLFDYVRMITHVDLIAYKLKIMAVRSYIDRLYTLYADIGWLDVSLSLASYLSERPFCRATTCEGLRISATGMYHPLVRHPVPNDVESTRGMVLTGSNASGKSTFLKGVGINVIFSKSFGFAFADRFEAGIDKLYSSMALSDDLLKKESYYVVEAKSIKRICDAISEGRVLCIIDEVLRGTNTVERIAASTQILKHLCKPNVICLAATHDLELTRLLEDDMDCYYFTEEINGDTVTFPFKINRGSTDKTNAIRLLSMLGYDEDIVKKADELVGLYRSTGSWVREK